MSVSRPAIWSVVAAFAAIVLTVAWFLATHDREFYEARSRPQPAALRNPWLATEMLLARFGFGVTTSQEAAALGELPSRGTVILSSERQYHLTPSRMAALLDWVEDGGLLIADASGVGPSDPLLEAFDVRLAPHRQEGAQPEARDEEAEDGAKAKQTRREPPRRVVKVPGYGRDLFLRSDRWPQLYPGSIAPAWRVSGERDRRGNQGYELIAFDRGAGRVVLVNGLGRFQYGLARDDHAEILLALVATHQRHGDVRIFTRLAVPSLFEWLWSNAGALLASAALLFILWLWRIVPRFGVLRPETAQPRRSLIAHLRAIGRFLWRQREHSILLDAARANVNKQLARRGIAAADAARSLRLREADVALALTGTPATGDQYAAAMATLFDLAHKINEPVSR
ncbi:MAG: hypothetical protein IT518_23070 [Burkholderiales bacterium]|nr:hypothetical protein [Burkholderiales bacterium]